MSIRQLTHVLMSCRRGYALVASKKVYFGVGGGVIEFLEELDKYNSSAEVVWEGRQVGRVILKI
jgi:hypothetical protein